jgi:hypothetical protein
MGGYARLYLISSERLNIKKEAKVLLYFSRSLMSHDEYGATD